MTKQIRTQQQAEPGQQPTPATDSTAAELSDEQLDQAAGGSWSWGETNSGTHAGGGGGAGKVSH